MPGASLPPAGRSRTRYVLAAAGMVLRDPLTGLDRVWERVAERSAHPAPDTHVAPDWERRLHELVGAPWPCADAPEFEPVWDAAQDLLRERGLARGRGTYGGWDDADPAVARAAWCLVRHLRPARVVETGVARGITTRVVLEALERNGEGRLWSIDLPPLLEPGLAPQLGAAVPEDCRDRWTLLQGSSRRTLPALLARLGEIDLFIHDSLHTERNVRFELSRAWASLSPGGGMLVDDVDQNRGFHAWFESEPLAQLVTGVADDHGALLAVVRKDPSDATARFGGSAAQET